MLIKLLLSVLILLLLSINITIIVLRCEVFQVLCKKKVEVYNSTVKTGTLVDINYHPMSVTVGPP